MHKLGDYNTYLFANTFPALLLMKFASKPKGVFLAGEGRGAPPWEQMMRQSCDCGCKVKTVAHQFTVLAAGWPWPGTPLQHLHTREGRQLKINSRDRFYTFYPRHTAPRPAHHTADPRFCDILLANCRKMSALYKMSWGYKDLPSHFSSNDGGGRNKGGPKVREVCW